MTPEDGKDEWDKKIKDSLRYSVRLMIKHPNIDPAKITEALGLNPNVSGIVGSRRMTPAGKPLPSVYRESVWSHWYDTKQNRRFFSDVTKLIDRLEPHKAFLIEIGKSGGSIGLIVELPGDVNIGDSIPWREMARLCALRIDLGIEVFPDFN